MDYLENSFNFMVPTELNLYYCGKREKTANHEYGPAVRSHFLIIFVKEGSGTILSEEPNIKLVPGAVFFMFPNRRIHYKVDPDCKWTIFWIGVYGSLVDSYTEMLGITPENPVFYPQNPDKVEDILGRIYNSSLIDTTSSKIKCISLVHRFFSELFEDFSEKKIKNGHINEAVYFMKLNYNLGISAKDVAAKLNIDQSYFTRIFHNEFGISPNKWLNDLRLKKACELLETTELPIGDIANSIGIFDSLYFSRMFRKNTGVSPTVWRKKNLDKNQ